jgi:hypothetical protein
MHSFWHSLRRLFGGQSPSLDDEKNLDAPSFEPPARSEPFIREDRFPSSYRAFPGELPVSSKRVFEPALKHLGAAYRHGEPRFDDETLELVWRTTRQAVVDHILELISASAWKDHLVLRGSTLLRAWLPQLARDPGDIDWVVVPQDIAADGKWSREFVKSLEQLIVAAPHAGDATISMDDAAWDNIWTYERVPGRRVVLPWKAKGLPPGVVQMDFVFGEEMPEPPEEFAFTTLEGRTLPLLAASKATSLAWKIQWLESDWYPQGKDLYDAVVLAENCVPSAEVIRRVVRDEKCDSFFKLIGHGGTMGWILDWDNFRLECPWIVGEADEWQRRLVAALKPAFRAADKNAF